MTSELAPGLLPELRWRGMLQDMTPGLAERLAAGSLTVYNGFDPTADSLHVGHLVPVFGLIHFQRHGNRPIAVVGGGTGMIGDPSGRPSERQLHDRETVARNVAAIGRQLEHFLDCAPGPTGARLIDNYAWLGSWSLLEFLRDIGKHFTIPYMLAKDSVQIRLESGLSFTEFSYMLLQSADFLHLYREMGVELQTGGADQWGNITAGLELIRRLEGGDEGRELAHALSYPLLLNPSGQKFGKSEGGRNVWLDPKRTSPFEFYQYWVDTADQDVGGLLRQFTLFDRPSIERLEREHAARPDERRAQRVLAWDITARVHSAMEADRQAAVARALFEGVGLDDADTLAALYETVESFEVPLSGARTGLELAAASGIIASNSEARRLIGQGGLSINGQRVADPAAPIPGPVGGRYYVVRAGKKKIRIGRIAQ
ncbi:MAG TPA: tyrosine--tRNA ligase [Candidatus Saccharimonadales bacterium]|nr:tyrosine--tRNA ligase [Candidatus Saccharimonadales bacterium]